MRLAAVAVAILALCGCASMTTAEKAYLGVVAADIGSTAIALQRGLEEQNPILRGGSDGETIARAVVFNAALYWLAHKVISRYTTTMQTRYWRLAIGLRAPFVVWNAVQISESN